MEEIRPLSYSSDLELSSTFARCALLYVFPAFCSQTLFDNQNNAAKEESESNSNNKSDSKKMSVERVYQKKTQLEHILLRPDTYIGSVEPVTQVNGFFLNTSLKCFRLSCDRISDFCDSDWYTPTLSLLISVC